MLRVAVNMIPHGDRSISELLAEVFIVNDGTGTKTKGNYKYSLASKGRILKTGRIEGFPRKRQISLRLLHKVLEDAYGENR